MTLVPDLPGHLVFPINPLQHHSHRWLRQRSNHPR